MSKIEQQFEALGEAAVSGASQIDCSRGVYIDGLGSIISMLEIARDAAVEEEAAEEAEAFADMEDESQEGVL